MGDLWRDMRRSALRDASPGLHLPPHLYAPRRLSPPLDVDMDTTEPTRFRDNGGSAVRQLSSMRLETPSRSMTPGSGPREAHAGFHLLAEASHADLVYSGNLHYNGLIEDKQSLEKALAAATAQNDALRLALEMSATRIKSESPSVDAEIPHSANLSSALSASFTKLERQPSLDCVNYPLVNFWMKRSWTSMEKAKKNSTSADYAPGPKGSKRASAGVNVKAMYIEDEDGKGIDGHRATDMRRTMRRIWEQLFSAGLAPDKWGQAKYNAHEFYLLEMARNFPELRLCEHDWKADQLATDNYPSWWKNRNGRNGRSSTSDESDSDEDDSDMDNPPDGDGKKRRRRAKSAPALKKKRAKSAAPDTTVGPGPLSPGSNPPEQTAAGPISPAFPVSVGLDIVLPNDPTAGILVEPDVPATRPRTPQDAATHASNDVITTRSNETVHVQTANEQSTERASMSQAGIDPNSTGQRPADGSQEGTTGSENAAAGVQHDVMSVGQALDVGTGAGTNISAGDKSAVEREQIQPQENFGTNSEGQANASPTSGGTSAVQQPQEKVGGGRSYGMRIDANAIDAYNLCAREWKDTIDPKGLKAKFNKYWVKLPVHKRKKFEAMEAELRAQAAATAAENTN